MAIILQEPDRTYGHIYIYTRAHECVSVLLCAWCVCVRVRVCVRLSARACAYRARRGRGGLHGMRAHTCVCVGGGT